MINSSFYLNCVRPGASVIISYNQCYAWRARAASTQSFTLLRKQVTTEITWWNRSIPCSCHLHISAILSEHPIRDMSCIQHCSYWVFSTAYLFAMTLTCTNHIFLCSLHLVLLSHPGHSSILLRSDGPSSMHVNLHTVAATNNKNHLIKSHYCWFMLHIYMVLFLTHIPFVVHCALNTTTLKSSIVWMKKF